MLDRLARHSWMQIALVLLVAACVYLPFLGVRPLDSTEGHRAVPGWTMLESGDYWHQKMFELTYIRKPPGIAWAIAASSSWLGETPFAARLPSAFVAILMSVLAWWYGRRWFGGPGTRLAGVSAGLAQALIPLMWSPGRTAEIEMLNNLGTQMFALGLIDLMVFRPHARPVATERDESPFAFLRDLCASARDTLLPTAGITVAALAKGPASLPVLGGVLIGACVAARSIRPLATRGVWIVLLLGIGGTSMLLLKFAIANDTPNAVREDVAGQFLWSFQRVTGVLTLIPMAMLSALPTSLVLLAPLARTSDERVGRIARTLAGAWVLSVVVLMLAGVSNARYAMPAALLMAPLAPVAFAALRRRSGEQHFAENGLIARVRRSTVSPVTWAFVMSLGAWWFVALTSLSPTQDQQAGVAAARHLSGLATTPGTLWANDAIEARPDVLWIMQKESPWLRVVWAKSREQLLGGKLPSPGDYLLLRTDAQSGEGARYESLAKTTALIRLGDAKVRRYEFTLYRVRTNTWPLPP